MLETHCSWVFLTGKFAYKIKKPVNFGFLDYSDLEKREHFCHKELKRNQLLAHDVYLEVVPIYQDKGDINFAGRGDVIEYAVKMNEFTQENIR
jgi:aminoglycoside phosphotransferase family enzyme